MTWHTHSLLEIRNQNIHGAIGLHPMRGVRWDAAGVACAHLDNLLSHHNLSPTSCYSYHLPFIVGMASAVACKMQEFHKRLAISFRQQLHESKRCFSVTQWIAIDDHGSKLCQFDELSLNFLMNPCHREDTMWYSLMNKTF
jgi:hypothetical protein